MGYGMHFPAHQVGGQPELWDIRGYGLSGLWVMTGPTVLLLVFSTPSFAAFAFKRSLASHILSTTDHRPRVLFGLLRGLW